MLNSLLREVASYGQILDSSLVGEAYLVSLQKRHLDTYGAKILRPIAVPIVALARLAVWHDDHDPTTLQLTRIGKDGLPFEQHKIRSMVKGSESTEPLIMLKDRGDERITKVGSFIRRHSLDELLQLYNVLNGEMSLVGPRPKAPKEFKYYCQLDPDFESAYTCLLPGITGLDQVRGRAELTPQQKIEHTKEYAAEACLALDVDILLQTAGTVFSKAGAY